MKIQFGNTEISISITNLLTLLFFVVMGGIWFSGVKIDIGPICFPVEKCSTIISPTVVSPIDMAVSQTLTATVLTPLPTATITPDYVQTTVVETLTAVAEQTATAIALTPEPTPTITPDYVQTAVVETLTAVAEQTLIATALTPQVTVTIAEQAQPIIRSTPYPTQIILPSSKNINAGNIFSEPSSDHWGWICSGDTDISNLNISLYDNNPKTGSIVILPVNSNLSLYARGDVYCEPYLQENLNILETRFIRNVLNSDNNCENGCNSVDIFLLDRNGNIIEQYSR